MAVGAGTTTTSGDLTVIAARCWRGARDRGDPVQPCLAQALASHDCVMLAPVFDSLLRFYEVALGRTMRTGSAVSASDDERLLASLVEGRAEAVCLGRCGRAVGDLTCALCSTRIMLALAREPSRRQ